ncbi:unnamed protein product [Arctia plantaginis]|uniref:RING-CH-type domain-containing protein n=1 Tax=Arctia plantaginis TaxID=874455 RepID=A0A8S1B7X1_ARCPL|nr:unnamed protein product [Arctia plantaginis]
MPNTRRRRFSVQNDIASRPSSKSQNDQSSHTEIENELKISLTKHSKHKNKVLANTSKNTPSLEIVTECDSGASIVPTEMKDAPTRADKDITASSSNIDLESVIDSEFISSSDKLSNTEIPPLEPQKRRDPRQMTRDRIPLRRDKHPRQHRIKVRSPKRRMIVLEQAKPTGDFNNLSNNQNTGTTAINWDEELELFSSENVTSVVETAEVEKRPSTHSLDDMCRICHGGDGLVNELGSLISACSCRGTVGRVHIKCLERWLTESGKSRCELCGTRYATRRVHRYGVPRALVMWILSQNAKQLMVDSLGIMLMSPLAVLAAWLSGRTLAGLMTQESHVTPWPLASTFVLACMTLVCYYCWIVSAATRHALGWWIWYRSQYEVRLQLQENEE